MFFGRQESSIHEAIEEFPEMFGIFQFILVTIIDSYDIKNHDIEFYRKTLNAKLFDFQFDGIVMDGRTFLKVQKEKTLFTGFDEIWCFSEEPKFALRTVTLVGPVDICEEFSDEYEKWMVDTGCVLGLGDGTGLNYITTKKEIAEILTSL